MRNFWISGRIDGNKTPIGTGPRAKDGGFELDVAISDQGASEKIVRIEGFAKDNNLLSLNVYIDGEEVATVLRYRR